MRLNRTNIVLAGFLAVIVMLTASTRVDYLQPNIEVLPDMKYTPAKLAYNWSPVFANGRTLQAPVPGTIARGPLPIHFSATPEDALRAGEELKNPFQAEPSEGSNAIQESIRRGSDAYRVFCICCHGATGAGDGPVTKRGFPPPPSLTAGKSLQMKDGQLFHILTYGQASMPTFAGQISPDVRWDVINYVRSLQPRSVKSVEEKPAGDVGASPSDEAASAKTTEDPLENNTRNPKE